MQHRLGIVTILCFTATLGAGCACGLPQPEDGALNNRAFAGTGALVARENGRPQQTSGGQADEVNRLKRAAAFRDYGRYYK